MGTLLFILSIILFLITLIPGIIVSIIECDNWNNYLDEVARGIDIFGNVFFQYILNILFLTKESKFKFGNEGVYCSDVLAFNHRNNTLTKFGLLVCKILIYYKDPSFI